MDLYAEPCLAVILSDFGRDAALRFSALLARTERRRIKKALPKGAPFFDEYRRISLAIRGEVHHVKEPFLAAYRSEAKLLDNAVKVGFAGGLEPAQIEARLGQLSLEAMRGPVARGVRSVLVLLPSDSLAPVSWSLAQRFSTEEGIKALLEEVGAPGDSLRDELCHRLVHEVDLIFPTVPEAVAQTAAAEGHTILLALGTRRIRKIYKEAVQRLGLDLEVRKLSKEDRCLVIRAIHAALGGDRSEHTESLKAMLSLVRRHKMASGVDLFAVEAHSDLDYEVGLDSVRCYVDRLVDRVYGG